MRFVMLETDEENATDAVVLGGLDRTRALAADLET